MPDTGTPGQKKKRPLPGQSQRKKSEWFARWFPRLPQRRLAADARIFPGMF
jgi:hypothetical protein